MVSGMTVTTDTSGGGGAELATGARRRAAAAPRRTSVTAIAAIQVAGLIKRFISIPVGGGDNWEADSAGMNDMSAKFPRLRPARLSSPVWVGPHYPPGGWCSGRGSPRGLRHPSLPLSTHGEGDGGGGGAGQNDTVTPPCQAMSCWVLSNP